MNNQTVTIEFNIAGNAAAVITDITQSGTQLSATCNNTVNLFDSIGGKLVVFQQATQLIQGISDALNSAIQPGIDLNSSLQELSAITGVVGDGLKEIEGYARDTAKTFGVDAAQAVESYKLLLSQLSPALADTPEALQEMGNSVAILSKTMGGDTIAAAEVLTTAMNQYKVSTDDPIKASEEMSRMMNVMAAAAKEGSAELPQIKEALEQAGMAAKSAGVSFEETNAAIQVLDKAGKKGSEGGVALRNVMATLSQGRFLPKDVIEELQAAGVDINTLTDKSLSLGDRLLPLQSILNDTALFTKLFGKENANAAMALVSDIDGINQYTSAITGTNTAQEQASVIMESYAERQARIQAKFDDLKISIFNATGDLGIWVQTIATAAIPIAQLMPLLSGMVKVFGFLKIKAISAYTSLGMYNGYLKIGRVENLGFRKNVIQATVAVGRFAVVTAKSAVKGIVNMVKSLVTGSASTATFASVSKVSWSSISISAQTACKSIGVAIKSIPVIGWILAIVSAIISAIAYLSSLGGEAEYTSDIIKEAEETSASFYAKEKRALDDIFAAMQKTNPMSEERIRLVDKLAKAYPKMNAQLIEELKTTTDLKSAYKKLIPLILEKARVQGIEAALDKSYEVASKYELMLKNSENGLKITEFDGLNDSITLNKNDSDKQIAVKLREFINDYNIDADDEEIEIGGKKMTGSDLYAWADALENRELYAKEISEAVAKGVNEQSGLTGGTNLDEGTMEEDNENGSGNSSNNSSNNNATETADAITSGGKQVKNFYITIEKLLGENTNVFNSSSDDPQTAESFMEKLSNALQMVVNDVNFSAN